MPARKKRNSSSGQVTRRREESASTPAPPHSELDPVIHTQIRLGMLSALSAAGQMSFKDLRETLQTSDGNLSVHARKLEEAGYVSARKSFVDRTPLTTYVLTTAGRRALSDYLDQMEAIIRMARG